MPEITFRLQHLNLPARDPPGLARWYATTFGLQADDNKARGPGALIAFQPGEPINRAPELHVGFLVPSLAELKQWADRLGATSGRGPNSPPSRFAIRKETAWRSTARANERSILLGCEAVEESVAARAAQVVLATPARLV